MIAEHYRLLQQYRPLNQLCSPRPGAPTDNTKYLPSPVPPTRMFPPYEPLFSKARVVPDPGVKDRSVSTSHWNADPKPWGAHLWLFLHYSAANYPDRPTWSQKQAMKNWLITLPVTIPCADCSHHYNQYINEYRERMDDICSSKQNLTRFLVDIHNRVNARTGKPLWTYEQALRAYESGAKK
jgi:hypothetical protein